MTPKNFKISDRINYNSTSRKIFPGVVHTIGHKKIKILFWKQIQVEWDFELKWVYPSQLLPRVPITEEAR